MNAMKKSRSTQFLLTLFFGPLGLFYSSAPAALGFALAAVVFGAATLGFAAIVIWIVVIFVGFGTVDSYNARIDLEERRHKELVQGYITPVVAPVPRVWDDIKDESMPRTDIPTLEEAPKKDTLRENNFIAGAMAFGLVAAALFAAVVHVNNRLEREDRTYKAASHKANGNYYSPEAIQRWKADQQLLHEPTCHDLSKCGSDAPPFYSRSSGHGPDYSGHGAKMGTAQ